MSTSKAEEASSPAGGLIADFDRYLEKVFGLSAATRCYRRRYAEEFLAWRFKRGPLDPAKLCFADFVRYINFRTPSLQRTSVGVIITSLRSLTRFLEFEERCPTGLSQAWPTVPSWKQSPPPNVLTWKESCHLLRTAQRTSTSRLRDEAVLRLMIELGLRCSEVAQLDLVDIDWRAGTLAVRKNKQRRERLLPLPPSVGEAISKYLVNERPASYSGRLFVCRRYLVGQPMTAERVRGAVRRAMQRNGLAFGGPHRLRHTFATRLHERGAALKEVADILGHQDFNATAIYARVNLVQLRQVALPWPGGPG
jgi:site-specific recombinase XerD